MKFLKDFLIGIAIGTANIIPGVSGGTIAVIFNVYDKLLIVSSFNIKEIRARWRELIFLLMGVVVGIFAFAKLITMLYTYAPILLSYVFLGMIFGSIPFLKGKIKGTEKQKIKMTSYLFMLMGFLVMLALFILEKKNVHINPNAIITSLSLQSFIWIAFVGFIGGGAMLLPGISGSFVVLLFGLYQTIMQAISSMNIPILIPMAVGAGLGIFLMSRIINFLLANFEIQTYSLILGLVIGSALYLFPRELQALKTQILAILFLLISATLIMIFTKQENKGDKN